MTPQQIIDPDNDLENIYICALRYAIGRKTYIVSVVIDFLMRQKLSKKTIVVMVRDIERERDSELYNKPLGDKCDEKKWLELLEHLKKNI